MVTLVTTYGIELLDGRIGRFKSIFQELLLLHIPLLSNFKLTQFYWNPPIFVVFI